MANPLMRTGVAVHNTLYRLLGGRVVGRINGSPVLLLNTIGAKSGKRRTIPLVYLDDDGRYLLAASAGGSDAHPAWFYNLTAGGDVTIQVGRDEIPVDVDLLSDGPERDSAWDKLSSTYDQFQGYEAKTSRLIPMIALTPKETG